MLKIKELREERNIMQKDIADELNIPRNTFSQYENDKREPDYQTLGRIADYFGVSIDYLLGKTDIKYTPEMLEAYKKGMEIRERQEKIDTSKLRFGLSADDLEHLTEEQKSAIKILAEGFIKENYKKERS